MFYLRGSRGELMARLWKSRRALTAPEAQGERHTLPVESKPSKGDAAMRRYQTPHAPRARGGRGDHRPARGDRPGGRPTDARTGPRERPITDRSADIWADGVDLGAG